MAEIFKQDEDSYEIDVPKEQRYLNTMSYDYSVQYLYDLIKKGKIVLDRRYFRCYNVSRGDSDHPRFTWAFSSVG